jgi:hypothetical protein
VGIDGHRVGSIPSGSLDSVQLVGDASLSAGNHVIELNAGPAPTISYGIAVGLQALDPPSAPVCIGHRRYAANAARPVEFRVGADRTVLNCGSQPLRLDWVEPAEGGRT